MQIIDNVGRSSAALHASLYCEAMVHIACLRQATHPASYPEKGYNTLRVQKNANSEEARQKNRESSLKFYKEHPEMREQIRSKNYCRPVICLETGIIYPSLKNCGKMMHVDLRNLRRVCNGGCRKTGGYSFTFV